MIVYSAFFNISTTIEGEEHEDLYFSSLQEARQAVKETLMSMAEHDGDYVEINRMDVITSGRGWVLNILNRKRFVRSGSIQLVERYEVRDERIVRVR